MKKNKLTNRHNCRWKRFSYKSYAVFCSLKKEVSIGVLTVATLYAAGVGTATAQVGIPVQLQNYELEEIEVTGTRVPLTETESAKMVTVLTRKDIQAAAVHSINDLLKYAVGVDIRQRGELGIQTDVSIRGGTFDQITILLNGVNITNPQTGHHSAGFPVSMNDIERIEVLEGPASRVFGTSAFTGAINVVTRSDRQNNVSLHALGGAYGLAGGGGGVTFSRGAFSNQVSAGYNRSDGANPNSDFDVARAYYQGKYHSERTEVRWQMGFSDQAFGANTFYSPQYNNQYEELRRYLFSVQAETKGKINFSPSVYWNRTYDHFQLVRNDDFGENFHLSDVYGVNLNSHVTTSLGKTALGAELRNEGILSTNLGKPLDGEQYVEVPGQKGVFFDKKDNRSNVSYYLEHNFLFPKWTVSMGVMANMNTGLDHRYRFYPGTDISYRPGGHWKLVASWNKALRMPTFTDLYYQSPTLQGNIGLKPEKTEAINLGATYRNHFLRVNVSGFYHKGKNMIDWVQYDAGDKFHSANFELDNMGFEVSSVLRFGPLTGTDFWIDNLHIAYAYIHQGRQDKVEIYKSNYALEYLRHKLVVRLEHRIRKNLDVSWAFRLQNRVGSFEKYEGTEPTGKLVPYPAFGLLDVKVSWTQPAYCIFAEATNLLDKRYYDLGNIPQPGIWIRGGITYRFDLK